MTKKLTGREAVIALMEGKKIFRIEKCISPEEEYRMELLVDKNNQPCIWTTKSPYAQPFSFDRVLSHDDWELVPMVWEGVEDAEYTDAYGAVIQIPHEWRNKRVKVRIEEIL